jgi:hypothetical protein
VATTGKLAEKWIAPWATGARCSMPGDTREACPTKRRPVNETQCYIMAWDVVLWHIEGVTNSPRWPLPTVKALVAQDAFTLSGSVHAQFPTDADARQALSEIVAALTLRSFSQQLVQAETFDVYGVKWGGRSWYLKYTVTAEPGVLCISLHKPKFPIRTKGGVIEP